MNESDVRNLESINTEGLESMLMDPKIRAVLNKIRTYNELLKAQPITSRDHAGMVLEINNDWAHLMKGDVVFTGRASFPFELDPERPIITSYFEEEVMHFFGVEAERIDTPEDAREPAPGEIYCQLRVSLRRECIDYRGARAVFNGTAAPEDVATMELTNGNDMSVERSRWILEELQYNLVDEIDGAIFQDTDDECVRVLDLSQAVYELTGDEETDALVHTALDVYTNHFLKFDTQNGYGFSLEGFVWASDGQGHEIPDAYVDQGLAEIISVVWREPIDGTDTLIPHLKLRICTTEIEDTSELPTIIAPVSSFKQLSSLRRNYYGG